MKPMAVQHPLTLLLANESNHVAHNTDNSWLTAWNAPQRIVPELILRKLEHYISNVRHLRCVLYNNEWLGMLTLTVEHNYIWF